MGLFDIFSGSDEAEEAAARNAALYNQYGIDIGNLFNQYQTGARSDVTGARDTAVGTLGTGLERSLDALRTGTEGALTAGRAGVDAYTPLSRLGESYAPAVKAYYDALGLTGPEGVQRTQQRFTTGPGYQFQVDEATKNAINAASRTGAVGGGSTAQAIADRARGLASGEYGSYLDRLAGFVNPQLQATQAASAGISGANKTLADIYTQGYGTQAAAVGGATGAQAGYQYGAGGDLANIWGNYAAGRGQTLKDITAGNAAANQAIAQAGQTDASNLWGLLGAGVKAAGAGFGGGMRA